MGEEIPEKLKQLSLQYIRVSGTSCEVNLYKAPGKGIGYFVVIGSSGEIQFSWHNYFESWENHNIDVVL